VVILFTVPIAFVGAMLGLLISGNPFSLITLFGMVALAGRLSRKCRDLP
jgi:multidrug efflux pump subunit AcrB